MIKESERPDCEQYNTPLEYLNALCLWQNEEINRLECQLEELETGRVREGDYTEVEVIKDLEMLKVGFDFMGAVFDKAIVNARIRKEGVGTDDELD